MSELTVDNVLIVVPRGAPDSGTLELNLGEVRRLEARQIEVASVSKMKAPELMHALTRGYLALATELIPKVTYERTQAEVAVEERRAVVMLDEAPRILREKKLTKESNPSGTADQRENVLALDAEYKKASNTVAMLKAVETLLKGKMHGFEMHYQTVKKVFDSMDRHGALGRPDMGLTELPDGATAGDDVITTPNGFKVGTPRY